MFCWKEMNRTWCLWCCMGIAIGLCSPGLHGGLLAQAATQRVWLQANSAFAGTGDIRGLSVAAGWDIPFARRLAWSNGLMSTFHDDEEPLYFTNPITGALENSSLRMTTAGMQWNSLLAYALVQRPAFELQVAGGTVVRYQTTSMPNAYGINYPTPSDPIPRILFNHTQPMRTLAIGGMGQLAARYLMKGAWYLQAQLAWQIDSQGDTFGHMGLGVGWRIRPISK